MRARRGLLITGILLASLGVATTVAALWYGRGFYTVTIAGGGMEPTYLEGTRVAVERSDGEDVRRGDVVLYTMPDRYGELPIPQRVIGLGGDRVVFAGGKLTVNGAPVSEPYVEEAYRGLDSPPYDVTVPPGRMFLLGDNRGNSNDSRYFLSEDSGTVPTTAVQGRPLKNRTVPPLRGPAVVLGVLLTVGGGVCVLAGRPTRRRAAATAATFTVYR
ncbi:signal peptidase I [Streptomyces sp. NBC_01508]|uniref:signal peptidase I n=1 Tax=Streptomyces sp. NBC_01508 TaxID=2903888 RepID=UPI00386C7C0C